MTCDGQQIPQDGAAAPAGAPRPRLGARLAPLFGHLASLRAESGRFVTAMVTPPPMLSAWAGLKTSLPDLIAATVVMHLLGLALPVTLLQVYDRILANGAIDTLVMLAITVVVAVTLETVLRLVRSTIMAWTSGRFEYLSMRRAFDALLGMELGRFERNGAGGNLEAMGAVQRLKEFYAGQAFVTVVDLPFVALYLVMLGIFGGWLVLVPVLLGAVLYIVGLSEGRRLRAAIRHRAATEASRTNFVLEILAGMHTVKSLAMEALILRRFERLLERGARSDFQVAMLSAKAAGLAMLFSNLTTILVVSIGSLMVIEGDMTTGVLAACSLLAGRTISPIQAILDRWHRFQAVQLAENQLDHLLRGEGEETGGASGAPAPVAGELALDGLSLSFGERVQVLDDISLTVRPGEMVGITGENGGGKTSLLLVAAGIIPSSAGEVRIDGLPLAPSGGTPPGVAYISQRTEMYEGSILDNLTLFDPCRAERAMELSKALGIHRFVSRLPLGYDTHLGQTQDSLPRGIRQLIAIARTLAGDPRIVLMDECSTALDGAGHVALRGLLAGMKGTTTLVMVSARPSMLNLCDRVFDLTGGRLFDVTAMPAGVTRPSPAARALGPEVAAPAGWTSDEAAAADELQGLDSFDLDGPLARCLLPLLGALGWKGGARRLAEVLPHGRRRLDLVTFRNVMGNLGYSSSLVPLRGIAPEPRVLPCLLLANDGRPLVLTAVEHGVVTAHDGASGQTIRCGRTEMWGTACLFSSIEEGAQAATGGWLAGTLKRFRTLGLAVLGQSLVINLLSLGVPLFTMAVYDKIVATGDAGLLVSLLVGVLIVVFGEVTLRLLRAKAMSYVGTRVALMAASTVFRGTLMLPLQATERVGAGAHLARMRELDVFRALFADTPSAALIDLPFLLVYVAILMALGGMVWVVPVLAILLFGLMVAVFLTAGRQQLGSAARSGAKRNAFVVEALSKKRSLRCDGLEPVWSARFQGLAAEAAMAGTSTAIVNGVLGALSQATVSLAGVAAMTIGVVAVLDGAMSAGALIAAMMVVWRVLTPLQGGIWLLRRLSQARATARQIDALLAVRREGDERAMAPPPMRIKGGLTFSRVSIRYGNDVDPSLLGVSFQVAPGEVVAIVGPDGAGKSTLLNLVAGLYAPQAGSILIDDLDIRQLDPIELRKAIAYAPQVPQLFFGSIAQNLRLAHPAATNAELVRALDLAGVRHEVDALPHGIETRVGDARTGRVPAGLAQGLSLARAYLRDSPLVLLDEPVSGLDDDGDLRFRRYVESMRGRRTILVVTHRPSHLQLVDQIIVLEKGVVRLSGPAQEVRAQLAERGPS